MQVRPLLFPVHVYYPCAMSYEAASILMVISIYRVLMVECADIGGYETVMYSNCLGQENQQTAQGKQITEKRLQAAQVPRVPRAAGRVQGSCFVLVPLTGPWMSPTFPMNAPLHPFGVAFELLSITSPSSLPPRHRLASAHTNLRPHHWRS